MLDLELNNFIDDLSSSKPAPGGGGVSALVGALAASLGLMVGNLTVGKKKYADNEDYVLTAMDKLSELQEILLEDIKLDEECFLPLMDAYKLPTDTSAQKQIKKEQLEIALLTACQAPIKIMIDISEVVKELEVLEEYGSKMAYSDVGVAASLCISAINSASLNVYINTKSLEDKERQIKLNTQTAFIVKDVTAKCDVLFSKVLEKVK